MPGNGKEVGLSGGGARVGHEQGLGWVCESLLTTGVEGLSIGLACRSAVTEGGGLVVGVRVLVSRGVLVCRSATSVDGVQRGNSV